VLERSSRLGELASRRALFSSTRSSGAWSVLWGFKEMRKRGITLVEVIVVIAIVALLAALLFAVTAPARAQGRRSACSGQIRQFYVALLQYSADVDGDSTYPELHGLTYHTTVGIKELLKGYGVSAELWTCPSAPDLRDKIFSTYSFTTVTFELNPSDHMFQRKRKALIERDKLFGSKVPLVFCRIHDDREIQPTDKDPEWKMPPWLIWVDGTGALKSGRCNMVERMAPLKV